MTGPEIRVSPAEQVGTFGRLSSDLQTFAGRFGTDTTPGLDPAIDAARQARDSSTKKQIGTTADDFDKAKNGAKGLGDQDQANKAKADALDPNLKDGKGSTRGGDATGKGAGRDGAPRLTAGDLAKAAPYQSGMPTSQTAAPSMPQLPMSAMSAPMQAAQGLGAPIQSMLGSPGAISPILDQMLSKAGAGGGMDGGPASLPLGSAPMAGDPQGKGQALLNRWLGTTYAWGGGDLNGPTKGISDGGGPADRAGDFNKIGFDCSGWSRYWTHEMWGATIPRTTWDQMTAGMQVSVANARYGDLVFPDDANGGHVGVYLGKDASGQSIMCEAPSSGQTLKISPMRAGMIRTYH